MIYWLFTDRDFIIQLKKPWWTDSLTEGWIHGMTKAAEAEILNNLKIHEIKNTPSDRISTHSVKLCIIIIQA